MCTKRQTHTEARGVKEALVHVTLLRNTPEIDLQSVTDWTVLGSRSRARVRTVLLFVILIFALFPATAVVRGTERALALVHTQAR